jgi:hypothetical protein
MPDLNLLIEIVRRNCDVADARHGREATMCIYLLQMRELFCWERGLPLAEAPPRDALASWLAARESQWNALEDRDYEALAWGARRFGPFDAAGINRKLRPHGLVYGAGYGRFHRPHFFLAALERSDRQGMRSSSRAANSRDLVASPAASRQYDRRARGSAAPLAVEKVSFRRERRGDGARPRARVVAARRRRRAGFERMVAPRPRR